MANSLEEIKKKREEWEKQVNEILKRFPERKKEFVTESGIPLKRVYTPEDVANLDYLRDLGFPGEFPFTRGVYHTMYRGRPWTIRQYSGYGTAKETNRRFHFLLEQGGGTAGLSIAFDLPTQLGYDSDHPMAEGSVGRVGVAVDSLKDMEIIFEGIPLDKVSTNMTINATAPILLAMYLVLAEKQGVPWDRLNGTIQNDILKEYIARGTYIFPPRPSLRLAIDIVEFCSKHVPRWNTMSITGYHIREAGASAIQEIAITFENAITYIEATLARGLDVDEFAPRLSYSLCVHRDFFEGIASLRAARRLYAKIMRDRFKAKNPRSWMLRLYSGTQGSTLTAQQPLNNVVRVTLQTLAAVLGGVQAFTSMRWDEALSIPSEESELLAVRTQQIIMEEIGVTDVVDPLGGSYFIEALTNEIEKRVLEYMEKIEAMGGSIAAIEKGFYQKEILERAYQEQKLIESGEKVVIGVNKYVMAEDPFAESIRLFEVDPHIEKEQIENLRRLKRERDNKKVKEALDKLRKAAEGEENLMPKIIDAVRVYATIGEICDVLREVFGEYKETVIL